MELGLPPDLIDVVYNGVDLHQFRPRSPDDRIHRELGLPTDVKLVASIGQLGVRKGTDLFLRAASELLSKHSDVHCLLIGERHSSKTEARLYEQQLHKQAETAPLAGRAHFLGRRSDIDRVLPELTLLVHLARQEPLGRVLLEAAAAGCCIVATRVGGTTEIFPPESQAARLVAPEDFAAAAGVMEEVLTHPETRRCADPGGTATDRVAFWQPSSRG